MKIRVNPHTVEIVKEQTEPINEKEIKVSKCEFEFDEAITSDFVKEAYFTLNGSTYKMIIENDECDYPSEVLTEKGTLEIGVVAFKVENDEEIIRYNPSPDYFESWVGSLKDAENSEPITPTDKEQMEQAIENINLQLDNVVKTWDIVDNLDSNDSDKPLSANMGKTLGDTLKSNYYDEITYEKIRRYETDCHITTIPLNDSFGNQIKPYVAHNSINSPTKYARDNYTTLTINASSYITDMVDEELSGIPIIIGNGTLLHNNPMISAGVSDNILYLGIKADRSISEYKVNETTVQTLMNDGCLNVFDIYYKLIENGSALDLSTVLVKGSNAMVTGLYPRQCIGIKSDKTLIILTSDGRTGDNMGLTSAQTQEILLEYGCIDAWNIDGGGSTSTTLKGSKINRSYDQDGTSDRDIPYTLNFKKETRNVENAKAYSQIGEIKQEILRQILLDVIHNKSNAITNQDANERIGKISVEYGDNLTNVPTYYINSVAHTDGYLINISHPGTDSNNRNLYNTQFFIPKDLQRYYSRTMVNGVWTEWTQLNNDARVFYNSGNQIISASDTYEIVHFKTAAAENAQTNIINVDTTSLDTDQSHYKKFKVNKIGFIKIDVCINYVPKTSDADRYIMLKKGTSELQSMRTYGTVDKAQIIQFTALANNTDVTTTYSVEFKGKQNDAILKTRIFVETK